MPAQHQVQVAVVSPRQLYLDALQRLISSPVFIVIGGGRTLEEALLGTNPNGAVLLIVYDLGTDAEIEQELASIRAAQVQFPLAKSVVLTDCREDATKLKVVQAGVKAILSRNISVDILRSALELVLLGKHIVSAEILLLLQQGPERPDLDAPLLRSTQLASPNPAPRGNALLSSREHQIVQCLINGLTNKAIARDLDISEATVKVHVKALLRKTRLANRTQAAIWALSHAPEGTPPTGSGNEPDADQSWLRETQDRPCFLPLPMVPEMQDEEASVSVSSGLAARSNGRMPLLGSARSITSVRSKEYLSADDAS